MSGHGARVSVIRIPAERPLEAPIRLEFWRDLGGQPWIGIETEVEGAVVEVQVTLGEARRLAAALTALADEGDRRAGQ